MISIIDYNAGNLTSVAHAVNFLGYRCQITANPQKILASQKIIFPGVGAAKATMDILHETGLSQVLLEFYESEKLMLGICIGIQILFDYSEEEDTDCLGVLSGQVKKFKATPTINVPQIGWNQVQQTHNHWIFNNVPNSGYFYFVNSYYAIPEDPEIIIGRTHYGVEFCSAIAHKNLIATQFHLEKSGRIGLKMLNNFLQKE
ncbi:MAG: imidazole glycerol phosphate synthase subunit HisH [Candidatus Poribacteria bacterium]|nr:imidazole glycerol phosphate synthase subunit HisH [Candidatus Poribacteria bacterium]